MIWLSLIFSFSAFVISLYSLMKKEDRMAHVDLWEAIAKTREAMPYVEYQRDGSVWIYNNIGEVVIKGHPDNFKAKK